MWPGVAIARSAGVVEMGPRWRSREVRIGEIDITDFYSRLIIGPDGKINLQNLKTSKEPQEEAAPAQAVGTSAADTADTEKRVTIGKINLHGGNINFSDFLIKPNYSANLTDVQGTISDSNGALVPDAKVVLKDLETGKVQETNSSGEGFYRILGLAPGRYELTVEKAGYKKSVSEHVTVNAENVQGVDVILEIGEITAVVTIADEATQQLETENANINKAITNSEVKRLPQVGRDPYELARLTPGVFGDAGRSPNGTASGLPNSPGPGGSNISIFQAENQPQITANGQRISANNFQIDGVSVNSLSHGGAAVVTPNQESVKEMQISSSSYSAEDGRNSGAQIKVVSQNGWFAVRPSGTEDLCKIYAESMRSEEHLKQIQEEAWQIMQSVFAGHDQ